MQIQNLYSQHWGTVFVGRRIERDRQLFNVAIPYDGSYHTAVILHYCTQVSVEVMTGQKWTETIKSHMLH